MPHGAKGSKDAEKHDRPARYQRSRNHPAQRRATPSGKTRGRAARPTLNVTSIATGTVGTSRKAFDFLRPSMTTAEAERNKKRKWGR